MTELRDCSSNEWVNSNEPKNALVRSEIWQCGYLIKSKPTLQNSVIVGQTHGWKFFRMWEFCSQLASFALWRRLSSYSRYWKHAVYQICSNLYWFPVSPCPIVMLNVPLITVSMGQIVPSPFEPRNIPVSLLGWPSTVYSRDHHLKTQISRNIRQFICILVRQ